MFEYQPRSAGRDIPFSDCELFHYGPQETKSGDHLNEIAFPLGTAPITPTS